MAVAALQAKVAEAELEAAKVNLEHRRITAPLDAVVVELSPSRGRMGAGGRPRDAVGAHRPPPRRGLLNAKDYGHYEIQGRPVNVVVKLARGQTETVPGKIVYVKPLVEAGGEFLVRAEVQNRQKTASGSSARA